MEVSTKELLEICDFTELMLHCHYFKNILFFYAYKIAFFGNSYALSFRLFCEFLFFKPAFAIYKNFLVTFTFKKFTHFSVIGSLDVF